MVFVRSSAVVSFTQGTEGTLEDALEGALEGTLGGGWVMYTTPSSKFFIRPSEHSLTSVDSAAIARDASGFAAPPNPPRMSSESRRSLVFTVKQPHAAALQLWLPA